MSLLELLLLLVIACICGSVSQALAGYSHGGCLINIAVGFIGALLGTWLSRVMGLPEILAVNLNGTSFPIIWSIIGGAIFSALLGWISPAARRPVNPPGS